MDPDALPPTLHSVAVSLSGGLSSEQTTTAMDPDALLTFLDSRNQQIFMLLIGLAFLGCFFYYI